MYKKHRSIHKQVSSMDKLKWCLDISNGIKTIEPNKQLSTAYVLKAEDALRASKSLHDNLDWEISTSYYAQYFSAYAILMRMGITCENHSCTIAVMNYFLKNFFDEKDFDLLRISKEARINTQYYSNRNITSEKYQLILKETPLILIKCKNILLHLSKKEIKTIRQGLKEIQEAN